LLSGCRFLIEPAADKTNFWYTGMRLHSRDFNSIVVDRTIRIVVFPVGIRNRQLARLDQPAYDRIELACVHDQQEAQMNRRTLLLGTGLFAAMGVSAKSLAMDASLPMKVADIDPAFEKAFNAGDLDALLKLYDDQSVLVAEPGKPVKGLENIKQALMGFLALKLPIQLTVRRVYENGDVGLCVADWSIVGKGPDGKDLKLGGTSAEVVRKTSGGNWVYVIDSPYGTA
jgi:ketosteroid isomerase-like protein